MRLVKVVIADEYYAYILTVMVKTVVSVGGDWQLLKRADKINNSNDFSNFFKVKKEYLFDEHNFPFPNGVIS